MKKGIKKQIWIGRAKVRQSRGSGPLGNADGAYVNAIALSSSVTDFRTQVKKALADIDLHLERLEDAELFTDRLSHFDVDKSLRDLAKQVFGTGELAFGTFHAFDL